jgi:uncharacterized protein
MAVMAVNDAKHDLEIPLFPLDTVLFCGGRLPLRLCEPLHLDLISRCLKAGHGFGVVLTRQLREAAMAPTLREDAAARAGIFAVGTYATVVDFNALDHGMLGIVCRGEAKIRVVDSFTEPGGALIGRVRYLPEERPQALAAEHERLLDLLRELMLQPDVRRLDLNVNFDDARSVSWRLAELLPLEPEIKQGLLQMHLPRERLTEIARLIDHMRG